MTAARPSLRLRPLRVEDEAPARAAHAELTAHHFNFLLGWVDGDLWPSYLSRLEAIRSGRGVDVPATFLVADYGGELVGATSIRHRLNDDLRDFVGHIGYAVRAPYRRRGFATEILGQALIVARSLGIDPVLVTCAQDNVASARVIEHHGGVLEDVRVDSAGVPRKRYWIA